MTSNRIAFVFAMAVLAVFAFSGTEAAAPTLNNPSIIPDDSRVDGSEPMQFTIEYEDADGDFPTSFVVEFDGVATQVDMVCAADETACINEENPDGTWVIADGNEPLANTLVANVGSDVIQYNFVASTDGEDDVPYPRGEDWFKDSLVAKRLTKTDKRVVAKDYENAHPSAEGQAGFWFECHEGKGKKDHDHIGESK